MAAAGRIDGERSAAVQVSDSAVRADPGAAPPGRIVPPAPSTSGRASAPAPARVPPSSTATAAPARTLPSTRSSPARTATGPVNVLGAGEGERAGARLREASRPESGPASVMS